MLLLEDLVVYQVAMEIGDLIHQVVATWDYFNKKSLGDQFVRAADSIALNIAEGYGRYHFKENKQFCWYARGSLFETKCVNQKAINRGLINGDKFEYINSKLKRCNALLNAYSQSIGTSNRTNNS